MHEGTEIWRSIKDYEGLYEVSNNGRIRNSRTGRILKPALIGKGYCGVILSKEGKTSSKYIHRLVADAFLPKHDILHCVNHKDGNMVNNNVENLEWCTQAENIQHAWGKGLSKPHNEKAVSQICLKTGKVIYVFKSTLEAERQTGIKHQNIHNCCIDKKYYKTAGGFGWKFV